MVSKGVIILDTDIGMGGRRLTRHISDTYLTRKRAIRDCRHSPGLVLIGVLCGVCVVLCVVCVLVCYVIKRDIIRTTTL